MNCQIRIQAELETLARVLVFCCRLSLYVIYYDGSKRLLTTNPLPFGYVLLSIDMYYAFYGGSIKFIGNLTILWQIEEKRIHYHFGYTGNNFFEIIVNVDKTYPRVLYTYMYVLYIRSCNVIILWDTFLFIIYWRTKKLKEVLTLLVRLYDCSIIQILLHTYFWRIYAFLIVIQSFLYYVSNAAISYLSLYIC